MNTSQLLLRAFLLCTMHGALFINNTAQAQVTLVKDGRPKACIVIEQPTAADTAAARMLNKFVERISGTTLPLTPGPRKGMAAVMLGRSAATVGEDGYEITCRPGELSVSTGGGKGTLYGVCTLLERYMCVDYWAKDAYTLMPNRTITLPQFSLADSPAFRFRQTFSYSNDDPDYEAWFRLEHQDQIFAGDLWVHTFNRILPASVYGKSHPEYYSFINGQRRPGDHSQWCLSNPELFELVCHKVDSIFKAHPGMKMISISQNDGNNTYCQCPECKKVDEYEGSPSGSLIRFLNKLAARFPDKEFSTLAYLYSMHPPKHVKPLKNVNIMLCDIDCKREVPLTDNASGRDFVKALEGWARISDNIFIWDYGINFDNMVTPFPNFHILQKNLALFKKNHATMVFEQVNGQRGTDFAEMRAYMLAKLMWNPDQDADLLMREFLYGYYGAAAPYLYKYQNLLQGALLASGTPLWIYDSPVSHKNGMLNHKLMRTYAELFDKAEAAVGDDSTLLGRVQMARLPIQYSELEIARTENGNDREAMARKVEDFRMKAARYGVTQLNERNNTVEDYCRLYTTRFLPHANTNKAAGAKVIWISKPEPRYQPIAEKALTDGLYGGASYVESWVGWEGRDADFILDMGSLKTFSSVSADFLLQSGAWVLLPKSVAYSYSSDNKTYHSLGSYNFEEDRSGQIKFVPAEVKSEQPVEARYIRVQVKTIGLCPAWHYGVGFPAWFFIDEVEAK